MTFIKAGSFSSAMKKILWAAGLLFICLFLWYYPPYFTFAGDESQYVHMAWLLSQGKSLRVSDMEDSHNFPTKDGHLFFPQYGVGQSLFILPFALLDWRAIFLVGLLFHMFTWYVVVLLCKRWGVDEHVSLLYLFFPGMVFFSRTVMSEPATLFFITLGVYLIEKRPACAGACFGASLLIRYSNAVFIAPFFLVTLWKADWRKFRYLIVGISPFILFLLLYNWVVYGGLLSTGLKTPRPGLTVSTTVFFKYIITLSILLPFMLFAPFIYRGKCAAELRIATILSIIFFSWIGIDTFHYDWVKNLVIGTRYLFPLVPLLIVAYGAMAFTKIKRWLLFLVAGLLLGAILISARQYSFASELRTLHDVAYKETEKDSLIFTNSYALGIINSFHEPRYGIMIYTYIPFTERINSIDPSDPLRLKLVQQRRKTKPSYFVFADPKTAVSEVKVAEGSVEELVAERTGEEDVAHQFNATLVYSGDTSGDTSFIKIWKLPYPR